MAIEWLSLEQAAADVQSVHRHRLRVRLAKRQVVVPSGVTGEDDVVENRDPHNAEVSPIELDVEAADGELPLKKGLATVIAEECADEFIDDPHAQHASETTLSRHPSYSHPFLTLVVTSPLENGKVVSSRRRKV